jgi:hypothetical protein
MTMRGFGDAADVSTPEASNKKSGLLLIGLGALLVGAAIVLLPKHGYTANASRKKSKARKRRRSPSADRRRKAAKRAPSTKTRAANKQFNYWAKIIQRDLDAGFPASDVDASLRTQYEKDESDYRLDGINSAAQFVKGVRSKL